MELSALPQTNAQLDANRTQLRKLAADLEANFLSVMLKSGGLGETENGFSGGIGESQFASFLRDEQAQSMVQAGGLGLAEQIFRNLSEHYDAQ